MDPNECLKELRALVRKGAYGDGGCDLCSINSTDAVRMVELFEALDDWLSRGGFLPARWERKP